MNILICGGAGYIGSHMVKMLAQAGHHPITFDDLSTGFRDAVKWGTFFEGNLLKPADLDAVFSAHTIDAVMHFASRIAVGESVQKPGEYYQINVGGSIELFEAMQRHGIDKLIFSSTAAIFGNPIRVPIDEDHPKQPINPYGRTKWMVEQMLSDYHAATGLNSVSLRYFNAAGSDPDTELGERHDPETHLIPNILKAAHAIQQGLPDDQRPRLSVFGNDYPTADGYCIRDYIHVQDLCSAHLKAIEYLQTKPGCHAFNLGNGSGFSVLDVIRAAEAVVGFEIPFELKPRRDGDSAELIAANQQALSELGWAPKHDNLHEIVASAWKWISRETPS